jgi:hypothetical protein
LLAI